MSSLVINGGRRLNGSLVAQGSKNSALPILAATYLVNGKSIIHNCPRLSDVECTIKILQNLGCKTERHGTDLIVDSTSASGYEIPENLMREMRSSVVFLGAILGRAKMAKISTPGGCEIGLRPIDLHLFAMRKLGVEIEESYGKLLCTIKDKLKGAKITLTFPSVGATENAILLASVSEGTTTIINAAREPEIVDLANFLNKAGAKISGAGSDIITIDGVKSLGSVEYTVMPDRIVAATYLFGTAACKGRVLLKNAVSEHLSPIISCLTDCGCDISVDDRGILLSASSTFSGFDAVSTQPYPGFPTDAGPLLVAMATVSKGTSVFVENIFDNRFRYTDELKRMGADIKTIGRVAIIKGVDCLQSAKVRADDLRGGAALLIAAMTAKGRSTIHNTEFVDRGYENFEDMFNFLGADIKRIWE